VTQRILPIVLLACGNPPPPPPAPPIAVSANVVRADDAHTQPHPVELALARGVSCARMSDRSVFCWGDNHSGQIGTGADVSVVPTPTKVAGMLAEQIAAGPGQVCALERDGSVWCWGENVLGVARSNANRYPGRRTPVRIPGIHGASEIALGFDHACARLEDGTVKCWGDNENGELGNGRKSVVDGPLPVVGLTGATKLALGHGHSWALNGDGEVWFWGLDQLRAKRVTGVANITGLTAGGSEICTLDASRAVRCWQPRGAAKELGALRGATFVHAAGGHGCALREGQVLCWGWNHRGQTGQETTGGFDGLESHDVFVVKGLPEVRQLAAGGSHSCAISTDHEVFCWGDDNGGQLGIGAVLFSHEPVDVVGIRGVESIGARDTRTCALSGSEGLRCWGDNEYGQLGDGRRVESPTPVRPMTGGTVLGFGMGFEHTCALLSGDLIRCWGDDHHGYVGALPDSPQDVTIPGATALFAGMAETCALAAGRLHCWGATRPRGTQVTPTLSPLKNVKSAALGTSHGCALTQSGEVHCWGSNHRGQLGDGTTTDRSTPARVKQLGKVRALAVGGAHNCAIDLVGKLFCWGYSDFSQIGDAAAGDRLLPTPIEGVANVAEVSLSSSHSCVLLESGPVLCWGSNSDGQLGRGFRSSPHPQPAEVKGLSSVVALAAGDGHTCAQLQDGSMRCWGTDYLGQLGRGVAGYRFRPVRVRFR
jgi:alpha-tubulin suppressor-like RCC1 family protein